MADVNPIPEHYPQLTPYLVIDGAEAAIAFYGTVFFKVKMIMIALAGVNLALFNATIGRRILEWDHAPTTPWAVKLTGIVSLVLWISIVAAGRGIAYALPPP